MKKESLNDGNVVVQWMSLPLFEKFKEAAEVRSFEKLRHAISYYMNRTQFITKVYDMRCDRRVNNMLNIVLCGKNIPMELEKRIDKSIQHARKAASNFVGKMRIEIFSGDTFKEIRDLGVFCADPVDVIIFLTDLPENLQGWQRELKFFHELMKFCSNKNEPRLVMIANTGDDNSFKHLVDLFNVFVTRTTLEKFPMSDRLSKLQLWNLHWEDNNFSNMAGLDAIYNFRYPITALLFHLFSSNKYSTTNSASILHCGGRVPRGSRTITLISHGRIWAISDRPHDELPLRQSDLSMVDFPCR
ncbi:hypothetical protein ACTXT7_000667 [Hymenolepis weldensis]